jgi:type I restriction-modification system DNA methylase subunit
LDAFDEFSKILFTKLVDEIDVRHGGRTGYLFQMILADGPQDIRKEISVLFEEAKVRYPGIFQKDDQILIRPATLSKIVEILSEYSILDTGVDVKGAAYEAFLGSALPVGKVVGQFFTPKEIIDFAVCLIDPQPSETVCDPACGTGGFLAATIERVWSRIDESKSSPKQQMSLKEEFVSDFVFGTDIDERMVRLAKMNILVHFPQLLSQRLGHIYHHDGLVFSEKIFGSEVESKNILLTNPPFGSVESEYTTLSKFRLGKGKKSRSSPILFVERCLQLLKPAGRMAIVVPDPILNGSLTEDVRGVIRQESLVEAVVKLPSDTFAPYGSTAESSLLFLRKKSKDGEVQGSIFMAEARSVGYNRLGEKIPPNDLTIISRLYQQFKQGENIRSEEPVAFGLPGAEVRDRLGVRRYWHPFYDDLMKKLNYAQISTKQIREIATVKRKTLVPSRDTPNREFRFIGLGNVKSMTGELTYANPTPDNHARQKLFKERTVGSEIRGACQVIEPGDILFGKLRPYLRKVFVVPQDFQDGLCSSEFLVIKPHASVDVDFLAYLLRSDMVIQQLSHLYSGLGRPRVSPKEILSLRLPVPSLDEQRRLSKIVKLRISAAIQKRDKAKQMLSESSSELRSSLSSLTETLLGV